MEPEAHTDSDARRGRGQAAPSRAASLLAAVALLAVGLVPAASPTASAASPAGADTCYPTDPPLDVGLVLDRSGSMSGEMIRDARNQSKWFVENLTGNDQSGLVSYNSSATLDANLSFQHNDTTGAIENLTADGGTATGNAIDLSHDHLSNHSRSGVSPTMIVLSDGKTNSGVPPVPEADEAKADGVEIFTIAFGSDADEEELKEIASDPVGTHFYSAENGTVLEGVFETIRDRLTEPRIHASEAYGVQVNVTADQPVRRATLHGTPQAVAPPSDRDRLADETIEVDGVTVELGEAQVEADGETALGNVSADARSRITDLRIADGSGPLLEADLLTASAQAWSDPDGEATSAAGTSFQDVRVQGTPLATPVAPDTTIPLGGKGTLTLDERVVTQEGENATLRVNLVHLVLEDGPRTVEVTVGSAYAAAACSEATSYEKPADHDRSANGEAVDDNRSADAATVNVNPGGEADNGIDECELDDPCAAATGFGEAGNADEDCDGPCAAASGTGDASNAGEDCSTSGCVAASGSGEAGNAEAEDCYRAACVAASGTDGAANAGDGCFQVACGAASGTGDASNAAGDCTEGACLAASGTGDGTNAGDDCNTAACAAASGTGDASNAADDDCDTGACAAVAGTGNASNAGDGCDLAACVAVSGTGDANGTIAVSGTGSADGTLLAVSREDGVEADDDVGALPCQVTACVGVAVQDDADGTLAAASLLGNASGRVAVSGAGNAWGQVAASAVGDAYGTVAALSGAGNASGFVTFSGTGSSQGFVAAGGTGTCNGQTCHDVNATGPARGHNTAVSGNDSAAARQGAAVSGTDEAFATLGVAASGTGPAVAGVGAAASGTGPAFAGIGVAASGTNTSTAALGVAASGTGEATSGIGAAVSGTGPATTYLGVAASGTNASEGTVAVTGTGSAEGTLLTAGVTGTCNGWECNDVNATGPAQGHNTAVSPTDEAEAREGLAVSGTDEAVSHVGVAASGTGPAVAGTGAAVSATGEAEVGTGVAVSGCDGLEASLIVVYEKRGSPAPVCESPAPSASPPGPTALP